MKYGEHYFFTYNDGNQRNDIVFKFMREGLYKISKEFSINLCGRLIDLNVLDVHMEASLKSLSWSPNGDYLAYLIERPGMNYSYCKIMDTWT